MSTSIYSNKKIFVISVFAFFICLALITIITGGETPERKAQREAREAIKICKANSIGKITDEVCVQMEDDFRLKYGVKP